MSCVFMILIKAFPASLWQLCKKITIMKTAIYTQHYEHTQWLNKLSFYKDEISIMQKRLEEITEKNNSKEVRMQIEHFQNQLIIQQKNIDELNKHIKQDEKVLKTNIIKNEMAVDHRKVEDHTKERNDMESFEFNFNQLRKEFNKFLADRM